MTKLLKSLYVFLIVSILFAPFSNLTIVKAEDTVFKMTNDTTYIISTTKSQVTQQITFINQKNSVYIPQYELNLQKGQIQNIKAFDGKGDIPFTTENIFNNTKIIFDFSNRIIAPANQLAWTLQYDTSDTVKKNGRVYEITIPQVADLDSYDSYTVKLKIDKNLGPKNYLSPIPPIEGETDKQYTFTYHKDNLLNKTVTGAFGTYQLFKYTLQYFLKNPGNQVITTSITLPADKKNQQIMISSIDPQPTSVTTDNDGNTLALFDLNPNEEKNITVQGNARVWLLNFDLKNSGKTADIPTDLAIYTKPQTYWESEDQDIKKIASDLTKDTEKIADQAKKIFDYVSRTLKYSTIATKATDERQGAKKALQSPQSAVCMEYADLLIALLRSSGIPARELDGFAYNESSSQNSTDNLHAWVEVYIPPFGWMPVDPTWSSTTATFDYFSKLDTNHLVFVTKGLSSEEPIPPGFYKKDGQDNNISVSFATEEINSKPTFTITFPGKETLTGDYKPNFNVNGLLSQKFQLKIKNNSGYTLYKPEVKFQAQTLQFKANSTDNLIIPPFGQKDLIIKIKNPSLWSFGNEEINATVSAADNLGQRYESTVKQTFNLRPILWDIVPIIGAFLATLLFIAGVFWKLSQPQKYRRKK